MKVTVIEPPVPPPPPIKVILELTEEEACLIWYIGNHFTRMQTEADMAYAARRMCNKLSSFAKPGYTYLNAFKDC